MSGCPLTVEKGAQFLIALVKIRLTPVADSRLSGYESRQVPLWVGQRGQQKGQQMGDISDLERRLSEALDRIGQGLDGFGAGADAVDPDTELRQALEDERATSAQLEERLKAVHKKHETSQTDLESSVMQLQHQLEDVEITCQRLRSANARLRENNQKLRDQNGAMVGDPHLINIAMMTELDALRVSRDAEIAEMDAILTEMKPLLEES